MEKLEELLVDELIDIFFITKNLRINKYKKEIIVNYLTNSISCTLSMVKILVDNFGYSLIFNSCKLTKYHVELLNNYLLLHKYDVNFINCIYDCEDYFFDDLYLLNKIIDRKIKIKNLSIDLTKVSMDEIRSTGINFLSLNFNKISFELSSFRFIKLEKKDLEKILNNRKKLSISCKSMTLSNWKKFFNQENYTFENERYTCKFREIEFSFEKFLLLLQS